MHRIRDDLVNHHLNDWIGYNCFWKGFLCLSSRKWLWGKGNHTQFNTRLSESISLRWIHVEQNAIGCIEQCPPIYGKIWSRAARSCFSQVVSACLQIRVNHLKVQSSSLQGLLILQACSSEQTSIQQAIQWKLG